MYYSVMTCWSYVLIPDEYTLSVSLTDRARPESQNNRINQFLRLRTMALPLAASAACACDLRTRSRSARERVPS